MKEVLVATDYKFKDDDGGIIFSKSLALPTKKKLIKSKNVKIITAKKKISVSETNNCHKESKVVPILKNQEIVGIMTECSCGEIVKILFNYE